MQRTDNGPSNIPETFSRESGSGLRRHGGYTCMLAGRIFMEGGIGEIEPLAWSRLSVVNMRYPTMLC